MCECLPTASDMHEGRFLRDLLKQWKLRTWLMESELSYYQDDRDLKLFITDDEKLIAVDKKLLAPFKGFTQWYSAKAYGSAIVSEMKDNIQVLINPVRCNDVPELAMTFRDGKG